ncbi:uncharacterized protein C12orf50 homolog [Trichechus manatus latirostris]|uniref:Uncharacterized protein C12orf50 homolog n=1 Tax=Trichechus manatus latirostris TaxID=127582 RepID=A0A2Y9QQR8_TRIMA|nr:uncharacterized protein C12orf50 homolog [Trichechus manatus latirostris]
MEMQQNCSISCFWETQPLGCVKISCIFYHSKPRNINGLFLPPSSNITLQKETQEGIPPPTQSQEPLKPQESISRPIHHPLVLKTNFEEEEDEEDEQNDASSLWTKTPEEIEEKRAIKEMCYKSGEYYRFHIPPDTSSSKSVATTVEKELEKPLENGSELQEGDGLTVPTKFSLIERQGEIKASLDGKPRTDIAAFENGDNKDNPHPKRSLTTRLVPTTHVLNATENITMKCREDPSSSETLALSLFGLRYICLIMDLIACLKYKYMSASYNGSAWRKRIPFSKTSSKTEKIYTEPRRNGSK